ncbi:hypothetical protein WAI453_008389 [Rhynchosporium graminicola]
MAPRSPTPRSGSFIPSFRLRPQWSSRTGTPSAPTPVVNPRLDLTRAEEDDDTELQLHGQQLEGGNEESEVEEEGLEGEENEDDGEEEEGEEEDEEGAVEEGVYLDFLAAPYELRYLCHDTQPKTL